MLFPPIGNVHTSIVSMGALDVMLRRLLSDGFRLAVLWLLATAGAARVISPASPLVAMLVLANVGIVMLAPFIWDKHALPILLVLWVFRAQTPVGDPLK